MRPSAIRGGTNLSSIPSSFRLLHHRHLVGRVVDHEIAARSRFRRLARSKPRAERMERREPDPIGVITNQRLDALAHFSCGFVGKRDREHLIRLRVTVADEDARCDR